MTAAVDTVRHAVDGVRTSPRRPALRSAVMFYVHRAEAADALYCRAPRSRGRPLVMALTAGGVVIGHTWALYTDGHLLRAALTDTCSLRGADEVERRNVVLVDDGELPSSALAQACEWIRRGGCASLTLATVVADAALQERVAHLVDHLVVAHKVERLHRGSGLYVEGPASERHAAALLARHPAQPWRNPRRASRTSAARSR